MEEMIAPPELVQVKRAAEPDVFNRLGLLSQELLNPALLVAFHDDVELIKQAGQGAWW